MVERFSASSSMWSIDGVPLKPETGGAFVRYSDYAALEAQLAERVRVKPLVWKPISNTESESGYGAGRSEYALIQTENGWRIYGIPGESDGGTEFLTKEAAKAAAQADYERRILSALEATPAPMVTEADQLSAVKHAIMWSIPDEAVGLIRKGNGLDYVARAALTAVQEAGK